MSKTVNKNELILSEMPITRMQAAHLFKVDVRTITNWKKSGCPSEENGDLILGKIIRWRENYFKAQLDSTMKGGETKVEADRRRSIAEATMAEIEAAELVEDLYTSDDFKNHVTPILSGMRQRILAMPLKYNSLFTGKESPEIRFREMQKDARELLEEIAKLPTIDKKTKKKKRERKSK